MYGYIQWAETARRPVLMEREILRVRFPCVMLPKKKGIFRKRMIARAAGLLHCKGVTKAVFPEAFPWGELFEKEEIRAVDPLMLYRAMAARLVQHRLDACGETGKGIMVAVCAARLTDEVRRTVTELCIRNRYVMLGVPERNDEFCRKLRREYGVPLVQTEDAAQLQKAAVVVRFSPENGETAGMEKRQIDLFPGASPPAEVLRLSDDLETCLPQDCDRMQLLAALYYAGAVRPGDFRIFDPDLSETAMSGGEIR